MLRIDGTFVAKSRQSELSKRISNYKANTGKTPGLGVILVGEDPASQIYVRNKGRACQTVGMQSQQINLATSVSEAELIENVESLNSNSDVNGILVQLPLPSHIRAERVLEKISPLKDPDGLTYANLGMLWSGRRRVAPCTPWGVMALLEHYKIMTAGKKAIVVGRSNIVGKPMAYLLTEANATVTVCHSKTPDLESVTREGDIVVVAAGQPRFLGREAFKEGSVVIDVGMHRPQSGDFAGKLCGDVRYEELANWCAAATPVPGGVGPMTIQMLMENTFTLAQLEQ